MEGYCAFEKKKAEDTIDMRLLSMSRKPKEAESIIV